MSRHKGIGAAIFFSVSILGVAAVLNACSSIESRYIARDGGTLKKGFTTDGVPITVTMADKQGFIVTETAYQMPNGSKRFTRQIDRTPIPLGRTELFAVDMKRPVVGTASNVISLSNQYPTTVGVTVSDNTVPAILSAISSLLPPRDGDGGDLPLVDGGPAGGVVLYTDQYMLVYDPETGTFARTDVPS